MYKHLHILEEFGHSESLLSFEIVSDQIDEQGSTMCHVTTKTYTLSETLF